MALFRRQRFGADDAAWELTKVRTLFIVAMIVVSGVEIATAWFSDLSHNQAMEFLALNLTAGGASGFAGGLLGFIFGVPKSLTDGNGSAGSGAPADGARGAASQTNTNLEQISDWLTKVLVGAGLTSLASLPAFGAKVIGYLTAHRYGGLPGEGTLALFLMIYFAALGFFWSYIETRTTLTKLFNHSASSDQQDAIQNARVAPSEPGTRPAAGDGKVLQLSVASLTSVESLDARASAEVRSGNFTAAIDFWERARRMAPSNLQIQRKLAYALSASGRTDDAAKLIASARSAAEKAGNPVEVNRLSLNELFNALYVPGGYDKAIEIGTALLKTDQGSDGNLHLWLACAHGQRAAALIKGGATDISADKQAVLERLTRMKEVRPDLLPVARSVWRPDQFQGNNRDDDLTVFRDDPDVAAVLL